MRLGRESASADKALTRAREEFRRPILEIDDVVSILIHNPYCQTDVRQLFDDIPAAKSPDGNMVSIIVVGTEHLSCPSL